MEPGTLIAERYVLETLVGQGATGLVYRALDTALARPVAVKLLHLALATDAQARRRFVREARVMGQLVHPAAVCVLDWGLLRAQPAAVEQPYLVMEWLEGESLRQRLTRPLAVGHAVAIAEQVASVLAAAHALGLIHRDIKPENVLVVEGEPPVARVVDFGLARMLGERAEASGLGRVTVAGQISGTLPYTAPELLAGAEPSAASDAYALGCLLHELLVGAPPFVGSAAEVQNGHLYQTPGQLRRRDPTLAAALDELVLQLLRKHPASRPGAAEVTASLAAARASAESPVREAAREATASRSERALSRSTPPSVQAAEPAAGSSSALSAAGPAVRVALLGGDPVLVQALAAAGLRLVELEAPELGAVIVLGGEAPLRADSPQLAAALARGVPVLCEADARDIEGVAELLRRGVRDVVPRPAQPEELLRKLARASRRRGPTRS